MYKYARRYNMNRKKSCKRAHTQRMIYTQIFTSLFNILVVTHNIVRTYEARTTVEEKKRKKVTKSKQTPFSRSRDIVIIVLF